MQDPNESPELSAEEREQLEALMEKADDVMAETKEPELVFDDPNLEFIANPNIIGDGISPGDLSVTGLTPEMIRRIMRSRRIMTRANQPSKKYVKRAERTKKRKAQRKARKVARARG